MRFLIAPDSFKESLSAAEAAQLMREALAAVLPDAAFDLAPLADGGEGTAECLCRAFGGVQIPCTVTGPMGAPIESGFVVHERENSRRAVIETAACCGLMLIPPARRDPLRTTTRGVGEMMRAALQKGCRSLVLTLGGSGTNDGGIGMLQALGAQILDENGSPVPEGGCGLEQVAAIDLAPCRALLQGVQITLLCDVRCPLLGPVGATQMFGAQKGADTALRARLEQGMARYAAALNTAAGRDLAGQPGAGAAGGLGAALMALGGPDTVRTRCGADYMMEALDLEHRIAQSDVVIVGEGAIDAQSLEGKLPIAVAEKAKKLGKPVVAFVGMENGEEEAFRRHGIEVVFCILRRLAPLEETLQAARENLSCTVQNFARTMAIATQLQGDKR